MEALDGVFAASMSESGRSLSVGSVKSNIGHLEMAAGMAGLMKAILVVCEESVLPNVGLEKLNPRVEESIASHDFAVELPTVLSSLRETSGKGESELLVAGVSSFGYSGRWISKMATSSGQSTALAEAWSSSVKMWRIVLRVVQCRWRRLERSKAGSIGSLQGRTRQRGRLRWRWLALPLLPPLLL